MKESINNIGKATNLQHLQQLHFLSPTTIKFDVTNKIDTKLAELSKPFSKNNPSKSVDFKY